MAPLEARWDTLLTAYDRFTILVVGTFLLHETVYFTRWIPFWLCDHIPAMRKYKIQQVRGHKGGGASNGGWVGVLTGARGGGGVRARRTSPPPMP
jgi:hypothetical protein